MTDVEKDEIKNLPSKYRPLGAWKLFGYQILFALPLVGFICAIVFAFNNNNIVRRSYARSYFCGLLIAGIFFAIILVIAIATGLFAAARA